MSSQSEASPGGLPTLYRHSKRDAWGYAVLAEEQVGRRTFHFEDGRRRTFKIGWYELMKPIIKGTRTSGERMARSIASAKTIPRTNEPEMLTANVPHGKRPPVNSSTQPWMR